MSEHDPRPEERFTEEYSGPVGDLEPISIPDIRKRDPWYKVALRGGLLIGAVALVVGGIVLYDRWDEKRQIERLIRSQYPSPGSTIASLTLERAGGGKYTGTLVTDAGDTLDVFAEIDGRYSSWIVQVPLDTKRRQIRESFERNNQPVKSIELRLDGKKMFEGKVVLQNGDELDVRDTQNNRGQLQTEYEYARPAVERWVREQAELVHHDKVASVVLTREARETYSGSCKGESGVEYGVVVEPDPDRQKATIRTQLVPKPEHVERWVTHQIQKTNGVKVKRLKLTKRPQGDYAGEAVIDDDVVWEVRAGTPPAWAKTAKAGEFSWRCGLAPSCYGEWVRSVLEAQHAVDFGPVELKPRDGAHVGVATDENGKRYRVKVWRAAVKAEDGEEADWPELGGKLTHEAVPLK